MLRSSSNLPLGERLPRVLLVHRAVYDNTCGSAYGDTDADPEEGEARLGGREIVRRGLKDEGEGGKEQEEDAKGEGCIEGEEEHCRLDSVSSARRKPGTKDDHLPP
jgi:hypothetical protein